MKKFLKIPLSSSTPSDIPKSLDSAILAAAALKARSIRKKRIAMRVIPALGISAAAAAASIMAFTPAVTIQQTVVQTSGVPAPQTVAAAIRHQTESKPTTPLQSVPKYSSADMLALGDTTILEQENYNLAIMGEMSMDPDNFLI